MMESDGHAAAATIQGDSEKDKEDGETIQGEKKGNKPQQSLERKDSLKGKTLYKHGHLKVKEDGKMTYKKTPSSAIISAIQLGLGYSIGKLSAKPERDVLMDDFSFVVKVWFPRNGSRETPAHPFNDFKFKSYAPNAFRYFRDLFGMQPGDFLMSLSNEPLTEISNPGASGSLFFLSADDTFIVKTVQHKEATFLQQLLPGYYLNLHQNPRTLLPKFFGLYCYQSHNTNIRLAVMNNLLPSNFKCHQKYDLKGSTYKRKASKSELQKRSPVKKDLDFCNDHPEGIILEPETYDVVIKTVKRDCRVLESFKIMDYSLLLGIHNIDQALREKEENSIVSSHEGIAEDNLERIARGTEFMAALEAIQIDRGGSKEARPLGGIPAKNTKGESLMVFLGIIDILQSYRLAKKLEHGWKSMIHDGDTVSVHNPSYYASRFLTFIAKQVFQKGSPAVIRSSSKRRSLTKTSQTSIPSSAVKQQRMAEIEVVESVPVQVRGRSRITFADPPSTDMENDRGEQLIPPPYEDEVIDAAANETGTTKTVVEQTSDKDNLSPSEGTDCVITRTEEVTPETTSEELTTATDEQSMKIVTITTTTTEETTENDVVGDNIVTLTTTEEVIKQTDPEGNVVTKVVKVTVSGANGEETTDKETTMKELVHNSDSGNNTSKTIEHAQTNETSDVSQIEIILKGNDIHVVNDGILEHSTGSDNTAL